jgi:hypothetical protein
MSLSSGIVAVALLAAVFQDGAPAAPDCVAPQPPAIERPAKPERPATPSCVNEATHRHTCSNRLINSYEATMDAYGVAFDAYIAAINAYVQKLGVYAEAATAYGQCEQKIVVPTRIIQP